LANAVDIANKRGASAVTPAHLLLALLSETWTAAERVFEAQKVDVANLRRALDAAIKPRRKPPGQGSAIGRAADQVLRVALSEARRYGSGFVGTEHLLVGLLSIRDGIACAFLEEAGLRLDPALEYARYRRTRPEPQRGGATDAALTRLRVGTGYDAHAIEPGRRLVLGGVEIEAPFGLAGHSDADVVCHAIMDALLGAAALGDIGQLYPDSDPAFAGASSLRLLSDVAGRLEAAEWQPVNVDAVVVAQEPKIAPHVQAMRRNLAQALGLEAEQVGVKGTTTERLGFEGQGLGIAAHAVVLIRGIGA
jgi:2-C-methyl-D-erythritol 2,4-cyclodiphosphate synthase